MASKGKDQAAKLHEKHQAILADLLKEEDNKFCADCHTKGENKVMVATSQKAESPHRLIVSSIWPLV